VFDECQIFWIKTRIPIQDLSNCVTNFKNEWRQLDKNNNKKTKNGYTKKKYEYI